MASSGATSSRAIVMNVYLATPSLTRFHFSTEVGVKTSRWESRKRRPPPRRMSPARCNLRSCSTAVAMPDQGVSSVPSPSLPSARAST